MSVQSQNVEGLSGFELAVAEFSSLLRKGRGRVLEGVHLPPAGSVFGTLHILGFAFALLCPRSLINYGPSPFCALANWMFWKIAACWLK